MIRYLPVTFKELPVQKIFELDGKEYELLFQFNEIGNFVTVEARLDNELVYTTNLVYGWNLFHAFADGPEFSILPLSEADFNKAGYSEIPVDSSTFGNTVFLFYEDGT